MANDSEVCILDSNIEDIDDLKLHPEVTNLNLHCNKIVSLNGLSRLTALRHLNLSSNKIKQIRGLSYCSRLKTLDLSCNRIEKVEEIQGLSELKKLCLSYNQINDLSGLKDLNSKTHQLKHIELHGNRIFSLKHVIVCLSNASCITELYFQKDKAKNPFCDNSTYRSSIFSELPWIESLDGKDRNGKDLEKLPTDDITVFDNCLDFMNLSDVEIDSFLNKTVPEITTHKIDSVLQKFVKSSQYVEPGNLSTLEKPQLENLSHEIVSNCDSILLENKLSYLVNLCVNKLYEEIKQIKENNVPTECSSETTDSKTEDIFEKSKDTNLNVRGTPYKNVWKADVDKTIQESFHDENIKELLNDVKCERERRYKAEQSSKKLLEDIRLLQQQLTEAKEIYEAAICSSAKKKRELCIEKEQHSISKTLNLKLKSENEAIKLELEDIKNFVKMSKDLFESSEETIKSLRKQKTESDVAFKKYTNELLLEKEKNVQHSSMMEEVIEKQKNQIKQLQDLVVCREQEHKISQSHKVSIGSEKFQEILKNESIKYEAKYTEAHENWTKQMNEKKEDYEKLEDEFRLALQIEAKRYNELYSLQEATVEELHLLKTEYEAMSLKEAKSKNLLSEFTSLVKEQKMRIHEMNKCKCDMQDHFKERVSQLEAKLSMLEKNKSSVEILQQEKERMMAHICAQESVIQGLHSERKLWGKELAEQGASLSQERGRLDARLEAQENEISFLQKQLDECQNSMRIKSKLVDNQTGSIKSLKEEIIQLTIEKKEKMKDAEAKINMLKNEIHSTKEKNNELIDSVDHLTVRKGELKAHIMSLEESLEKAKVEEKLLKTKWDDRNKLINQFEEKVMKMKNNFDEKERNLINAKKIESDRADAAQETIKEYESKYRSELATMKHDFNLETRKVIVQKESEIQKAKEHVVRVEEEMRMILSETNSQKKNLESRLTSLSKAFSELQKDLT